MIGQSRLEVSCNIDKIMAHEKRFSCSEAESEVQGVLPSERDNMPKIELTLGELSVQNTVDPRSQTLHKYIQYTEGITVT